MSGGAAALCVVVVVASKLLCDRPEDAEDLPRLDGFSVDELEHRTRAFIRAAFDHAGMEAVRWAVAKIQMGLAAPYSHGAREWPRRWCGGRDMGIERMSAKEPSQ